MSRRGPRQRQSASPDEGDGFRAARRV